jgi:amino acid adenylation domain-containing protein
MSDVPMSDVPLHMRFRRGLSISPGGPAIRDGDEVVRYDEAYDLALRWAASLRNLSAGPGRAVGVLADKGAAAYIGILAALFTGATVVPLHPGLPASRTRYMAEAAGVSVVLADSHGAVGLREAAVDVPVVPADRGTGRTPLDEPVAPGASDVAYVLFTSGSTGRPKGVPITHGNLHSHFALMDSRYAFTAQDVFSQVLELNFDCAIFELFSAWGVGGTVCPIPAPAYLDLPAFFASRRVSAWFSTPSAITLVRRLGGLAPGSLPTLRWSFFAGEALKCSDAADWQAAASNSVVENLYGPTELTLTVTGHRWSPPRSAELAVNGIVPIGAVYPGHDHLLLSPDGSHTPAEGELCVTGPQMASGYLNPADNEGRYLRFDGRSWYRTGDRVRVLPGGELAYLGRTDSQVQIQGMRVELAEIDHAMRSCKGVTDAVTVTRPAEDGLQLVVFYTGVPASPVELTRRLRTILPDAMVPKVFRHVPEFPLNSNRKIDKIQLAGVAAQADGTGHANA